MPGIASAATSVVIGHVAGGTTTIRVGSGGDHAAEPCAAGHRRAVRHARVAVSRAASISGSAARRAPISAPRGRCGATSPAAPTASRSDVLELHGATSRPPRRARRCAPCPAQGSNVPIWILGLEHCSARSSPRARAAVRVRVAFRARADDAGARASTAARFQPSAAARQALRRWSASTSSPPTPTRRRSGCSPRCSSVHQPAARHARAAAAAGRRHGRRWSPAERRMRRARSLSCAAVGSPDTVAARLEALIARDRRGRADVDGADLRPRGAAALVRNRRRGARPAGGTAGGVSARIGGCESARPSWGETSAASGSSA